MSLLYFQPLCAGIKFFWIFLPNGNESQIELDLKLFCDYYT